MKKTDTGLVLIAALLALAFLTIVGSAFLSTATLDVLVAENFRVHDQLRNLAEAGIEEGRELLGASDDAFSTHLVRAAGGDGFLETSTQLDVVLGGDDRPLIPADPGDRATGWPYPDAGSELGFLHVFLTNDVFDGPDVLVDTNGIVTLVSTGTLGDRSFRVEADVMRRRPPVLAALMLDGPLRTSAGGRAGSFRIDGSDLCGGSPVHAVGVTRDPDIAGVLQIAPADALALAGVAPPPDVANLEGPLPGSLSETSGLEGIVGRLLPIASDHHVAAPGSPQSVGDAGTRAGPRIVVVDGDGILGPGVGYGILLVRGVAEIRDGFSWNGLVLVIGQGEVVWTAGARASIYGAVLVARTRGLPEPQFPLGPVLPVRGEVDIDLGAAEGGIYYDSCVLSEALSVLPVSPIAIRSD